MLFLHNGMQLSTEVLYCQAGMIYLLFILDICFSVAAQLLLRVGARRLSGDFSLALIPEILRNRYLLGGMTLFGMSFFLYVFVLSRLQINVAYPVAAGTGLVLITAFSYFFLNEFLTVRQVTGIGAIAAGIFLVLMPK